MNSINAFSNSRRLCAVLLVGTCLSGFAGVAIAQDAPAPAPAANPGATTPPAAAPAGTAPPAAAAPTAAPAPERGTIRSITVVGNQRLEPETVLSYTTLRAGGPYTRETLDQALKDLFATELFADVQIRDNQGALTVEVRENPVVNRIILEGNKRLKEDKINPEIKLAPRQIFTRSKVRADVARIIALYQRQGRYAAEVEPKIVQLDQNRVDVVFEISEGPRSKVRQINILGNHVFSDGTLRGQMATKQSRLYRFLSTNDVYDPDRLAYDQQKLRQFYLTKGYADFRVISATAELTPDRRNFIITYVVEEGDRYKFGDIKAESAVRDFPASQVQPLLPMHKGEWYDAKKVEDTITAITEAAGQRGYAFADVDADFDHNQATRTMGVNFKVKETPRVYVERINIRGNTQTQDKVIRREFRLAEGDPFSSLKVKRSKERIQSLGYFQDNLEIEQTQGSGPDRVILGVSVEDKPTGQLEVSAGYSSIEHFLVNLSIQQRNFMGRGQTLGASVDYSSYSKSIELDFADPYVFDRNIGFAAQLFRRDLSNFNYIGTNRNTTYKQVSTGGLVSLSTSLTESLGLQLRYTLSYDEVSLDKSLFYTDPDGAGPLPAVCDPLKAGRYLCDAIGNRLTSAVGYSMVYDTLDNRVHPAHGHQLVLSQDFAGLGGDVAYLRTRVNGAKYWAIGGSGFIFSTSVEGGYVHSFKNSNTVGNDPVRITDRFFLGEPQMRGFDIRGVGPRVRRIPLGLDSTGQVVETGANKNIVDDALGGHAYYLGRIELEIPLGSTGKELGLRPSIFTDVGALWGLQKPQLQTVVQCSNATTGVTTTVFTRACPAGTTSASGFEERYRGDTPRPRVSVGFGVNWNSPMGPFRIDIAKALLKAQGEDTKLVTFNVGTAF